MADIRIGASGIYPETFVVEMMTGIGSLIIHVSVPTTDENGQALSIGRQKEIARLRARAMAVELLANTNPDPAPPLK